MPIVSGKTTASETVANGSANRTIATGAIAQGASLTTGELDVPSLNRLTWVITQTTGVDSASVRPQVSFRRGIAGALIWTDVAPTAMASPAGVPLVIHINTVVCQAMRAIITHVGAPGAPTISASVVLSGSA